MNKLLFATILIIGSYACNSNQNESSAALSEDEKANYLNDGKEIAKTSYKTLSGELKAKVSEGGIAAAIEYCNVAAMPITDSLSRAYDVQIRRVSNQLRNPANRPDSLDGVILAEYDRMLTAGEKLGPVVTQIDDEVRFNAPIFTKPLCLNCHGEADKYISASDLELIRERYPNDQAIGYQTGDLRGAWSITFKR